MYKRLIPALLLVAYGAFLVKWMVFKDVPLVRVGRVMLNFGGTDAGHAPNFVPFATIVPYLLGHKGLIIAGINLVGNIILLVPLGFLIPFVYQNITWRKALGLAAASGLIIESLQVLLRVGIFDIDDVLLNALGFMVGYGAYVTVAKLARSMQPKNTLIAAVAVGIAALMLGTALYSQFPIRFEPAVVGQSDRLGTGKGMPQGEDLCGGTGGNGQVVSVGSNSFVMERSGGNQTVHLTSGAAIETAAGPATAVDLKVGDRVTLVGGPNQDGSFTAEAVFVCNATE